MVTLHSISSLPSQEYSTSISIYTGETDSIQVGLPHSVVDRKIRRLKRQVPPWETLVGILHLSQPAGADDQSQGRSEVPLGNTLVNQPPISWPSTPFPLWNVLSLDPKLLQDQLQRNLVRICGEQNDL